MNKSKSLLVAISSLALTFASLIPAQAADTSLTYLQFTATQGYKDLLAAADLNSAKLATATGLNIDLEMTSGSQVVIQGNVKATKTAVSSTMTMEGETRAVSFFDGAYYLGFESAATELNAKNKKLIGKRLPSTAVKNIKFVGAPEDTGSFMDIDPSSIFSGQSSSSFIDSVMSIDMSKFSFGEVVKSANPLDPTSTDYKIEVKYTDLQTGMSLEMVTTQTFNSEGFQTSTLIDQKVLLFGMTVTSNTKLTTTVDNTLVLTAPDAATYITSAKFASLDKQISAETALKPNASKIVTKAKALAKSAKKPLSGKHLASAAKALKINVKSVTNGIKLTGKYKGVAGSLCVSAVKGVATTKNC